MTQIFPRALRFAILSLASVSLIAAGPAPQAKPKAKAPTAAKAKTQVNPAYTGPWLYKGSDIPIDPAWTFGVLPNAVRYAVRRGQVPPRQVSIRVAIDAGSMMERDDELGFAHYIEHLSFRGSRHVPDGEAKRVWQRFGATFGSDSNAVTSPTQTIYKLDLPNATSATLDESLKILAGMMAAPSLTDAAVDAERRTVLAESREQFGPQTRVSDATRELFFHNQLLASRSPIGTVATLNAATAAKVKAFHTRWYRPDRLIISISGDGDPTEFETLVKKHFSDWTVAGLPTPDPDFGQPDPAGPTTKVLTEPGLPMVVSMAIVRPWYRKDDTIAYNQGKLVELVALRLINRRLESRARAGGSFLQANVDREDVARTVDGTFTTILPLGDDWRAALKEVRAVIADAMANPAPQDEIEREIGEFTAALDVEVESSRAEASSKQADDIIEAVNIRETVATAEVARDVFGAMRGKLGPADILAATKRLFVGIGPRVLLSTPKALPGGGTELAQALAEPVTALASKVGQGAISFDRLPKLPGKGKILTERLVPEVGINILTLSNGVRVMLFPNPGEAGRVYVSARFGKGMQAMPRNAVVPAWAGSAALIAGGIGDLGQEELDRMTSGRKIGMGLDTDDDAFSLRGVTRPADLRDQLMIMATKLYKPRWDPAPVQRARAAALLGLESANASPQGVLARELGELLHGGDKRWATARREDIEALTPDSFRTFWEPVLAKGEVELSIFGDFEPVAAMNAVLETFGALPPRPAAKPFSGGTGSRGPKPTAKPIIRTHKGPADQAAAILAWGTGGGLDDVFTSRKLEVLSAIFNDRLFERLREGEGGSYSPNVSSNWPTGMKSGGSFFVSAQLKPEGVDRFFALSREIAADLVSKPVSDDELQRAVGPMKQQIARASSGNSFWLAYLAGATTDQRRINAVNSLASDIARITPADVQTVAKRYLKPKTSFSMIVLPEGAAKPR